MKFAFSLALAVALGSMIPAAGQPAGPIGPVGSDLFHTTFVKIGANNDYGLLYQPSQAGRNARVAIVYASSKALFNFTPAAEMASRGYRVLLVKHYLQDRRRQRQTAVDGLREASSGIAYLRSLPGVERVVLMGHDEGGRMVAFYQAAAEQGANLCQRPGLVYPCQRSEKAALANLARPDGIVLLDPALGALDAASAVDPAYDSTHRSRRDLDMYAPRNGYDAKTGRANYSADFIKRFFVAQSARNMQIVDKAAGRLKLIEQGKGDYSDDEPFVVAGAVNSGNTARLYETDLTLLASTRASHSLLKADGTTAQTIVRSLRSAVPANNVEPLADCCGPVGATVRRFLDTDAIRTTPDFALTGNDIIGVDWKSSLTSTPASAESVTVPTLVLTMSCSHAVVPGEIVYDHLAAKDKDYVAVEGARNDFAPCNASYGDTKGRTFDFVDHWLARPGRF